jgi:hypothetical protein
MRPVVVRIFHPQPGSGAGPLESALIAARLELAERHAEAFRQAGAEDVGVVSGPPDGRAFGARLRDLVTAEAPAGLVVLGSGSLPLARRTDIAGFVAAARRDRPHVLANNRYSADALAIACPGQLANLPDIPADNALPRWLEEVGGYEVADLRRRWRLSVDLDSPLDLVLVGMRVAGGLETERVGRRLQGVATVARNRRAQLVVTGRTSAGTLAWLERGTAARIRALVEERGLRASTALAMANGGAVAPPRSVLGLLLDRDGPEQLGPLLAELGDAALVDSRVLLAHRLGVDERAWPAAEDRFASDLLLADRIADPWLRALTRSAAEAPIPVVLGGHTLVGPGARLVLRRPDRRMAGRPS